MAFALGETIEPELHIDVVGQQRDLDAAAQSTQAQCDHRLAQLKRGGDVVGFGGWDYYDSCIVWTGYNWVNVCY